MGRRRRERQACGARGGVAVNKPSAPSNDRASWRRKGLKCPVALPGMARFITPIMENEERRPPRNMSSGATGQEKAAGQVERRVCGGVGEFRSKKVAGPPSRSSTTAQIPLFPYAFERCQELRRRDASIRQKHGGACAPAQRVRQTVLVASPPLIIRLPSPRPAPCHIPFASSSQQPSSRHRCSSSPPPPPAKRVFGVHPHSLLSAHGNKRRNHPGMPALYLRMAF